MPCLKKIRDLIGNRVLSHGTDSTVSEFFEEVRKRQPALEQAYTHVLGKEIVGKVLELDKNLFPLNSYLFDISSLKRDIALTYPVDSRKDFLFNVIIFRRRCVLNCILAHRVSSSYLSKHYNHLLREPSLLRWHLY